MIGAISNPTKKVTMELSLSQVQNLVMNLPKVHKKYKLSNQNPMFNQYTFDASEFLSLGVYIDVNLNPVTETRTEINIEVRRKMGAFDNWVEVQNANEHIQKILDGLTRISKGDTKPVKETSSWEYVVGFVIGIIILSAILN